jgi:hypothetical protein
MASTDRARLAFVRETTAGNTPTNPAFQIARVTGGGIGYQKQTIESAEIDYSANPADMIKVGAKSAGSIPMEWSPGTWNSFLEAGTRGTFSNVIDDTGAHVMAASTSTGTLTAAGAFANAAVGQWVLLSGFVTGASYTGATDSPNNGWFKIKELTSSDVVVLEDPANKLVNETGPASANVKSSRLLNGVASRTYTIEQGFMDVAAFFRYMGQKVNTLSMSVSAGAAVTGEIGFMGSDAEEQMVLINKTGAITVTATTRTISCTGAFADAVVGQRVTISGMVTPGNNVTGEIATNASDDLITLTAATSTLVDEVGPATANVFGAGATWSAGGTYTAATSAAAFNATSNVGEIIIDGELSTACFRTLNININQNIRETQCIANEFPTVTEGQPTLTGSFEKIFTDTDLWRVMHDHDTVSLEFGFASSDGTAGIHVSIPEILINTDPVDLSGGKNSEVYDKVDFSASKYTNAALESYYVQFCVA